MIRVKTVQREFSISRKGILNQLKGNSQQMLESQLLDVEFEEEG